MLQSRIATCFQRFFVKDSLSIHHLNCINLKSRSPISVPIKLFSISPPVWTEPVIVSASQAAQEAAIEATVKTSKPALLNASSVTDVGSDVVDPAFVDIGLAAGWWPYQIVEGLLESFYLTTGCPWWLTIVAGTVALRVVTLPMFIFSRKFMMNFNGHMSESTRLRQKMMDTSDLNQMSIARKNYYAFVKKHKIGTGRLLVANLGQPFFFISCIMALRNISSLPLPSLQATEFLWITSLADPDPYRILPFIAGCMIGINIIVAVKTNASMMTSEVLKRNMKYVALLPPILMPLVFGGWSSSLAIYIVTNSMVTVAVTAALSPLSVQKQLGLTVQEGRKSVSPVSKTLKEAVLNSREKTYAKMEKRQIKQMLKADKRARKKELKKSPPVLFDIGTEAILKSNEVSDFEKDWRPPRVDIYKLNSDSK